MQSSKLSVPADYEHLGEALDFVENTIKAFRYKRKLINEALMLSEEAMVNLIEGTEKPEIGEVLQEDMEAPVMEVVIKKYIGHSIITISAPGKEIDLAVGAGEMDIGALANRESESTIRKIFYQSYSKKITYMKKDEYNYFSVMAGRPEMALALESLLSFALALLVGGFLRLLIPDGSFLWLEKSVLEPVEQIFLNILSLISGPTVFLTIVINVVKFRSFHDPGHISYKVMWGYFITSLLAICVGAVCFSIVLPGELGRLSSYIIVNQENTIGGWGILGDLSRVIPNNIVEPFLTNDTLQLLLLALLVGMALGKCSDFSNTVKGALEALNTLCSQVTDIMMRVVPVAVFAAVLAIVLQEGFSVLISLFQFLVTLLLGIVMMFGVYSLLVLIFARLNPIVLLKKYAPIMWETFLNGSEIATMPKTLSFCRRKLGVSPKICMFSIPFGSIINTDGNCIYLVISSLFVCRLCGIDLVHTAWLPFVIFVLILSIGAPIASGSVLLCLTILLNHVGVSVFAIGILIGVNFLFEMMFSVSNGVGDVVITLIVGNREKLLDREMYYK